MEVYEVMENNQQKKVGTFIKTLSIIQLALSVLEIIGYLSTYFMKDLFKTTGVPSISTATVIIYVVITLITALSIILILSKRKLGIYAYFIAQLSRIVYTIVNTGVNPSMLLSLIIPILLAIFIWQKKDVFDIGSKLSPLT